MMMQKRQRQLFPEIRLLLSLPTIWLLNPDLCMSACSLTCLSDSSKKKSSSVP
uniref:Uncharacterized protein n=1 Tax=Setaria viridis TaxID=4556 RepID=A0A4U6UF73_SETVI|nr:hypothetical protein SEVIR_6G067350v2 [Setaria viridis]